MTYFEENVGTITRDVKRVLNDYNGYDVDIVIGMLVVLIGGHCEKQEDYILNKIRDNLLKD